MKYMKALFIGIVLMVCGVGIDIVYSPSHTLASLSFIQGAGSTVGTLTAGSTLTMSPIAASTTVTQAHGLGGIPSFGVMVYLQCLTAELNYSIGDRLQVPGTIVWNNNGILTFYTIAVDATNVILRTPSFAVSNLQLPDKSTGATTAITLANWKIVAVPYRLN